MRRTTVVLTTAALAAGALVAAAGPAAADHLVTVGPESCTAGPLSANVPDDTTSDRVSIQYRKDGSARVSCHFAGLPEQYYNEEYGFLWERPDRAQRSEVVACLLVLGDEDVYSTTATIKVTPGGTAKIDCTFDVPA